LARGRRSAFRSARVSRPLPFGRPRVSRRRATGRGLGHPRSQRTGGSGDHCPNQLAQDPLSPVLDGRAVGKSRLSWSSGSHQCPQNSLRRFSLQRKPNRHQMIFWFWTRPAINATPDPLRGHCDNNVTCVQLICLVSPKSTASAKASWAYA